MDTGPVEPKKVATPGTTALVALGILFILGVIVLAAVWIAQGAKKAAPALRTDWKYIGDVRARDAAQVREEKKAGDAYRGRLVLTMAAAGATTDKGLAATLTGKLTNTGGRTVLKATAPVRFAAAGGAVADTREVTLFDATPLSMTSDKPLGAGDSREFSITVSDVNQDWDLRTIEYSIGEVRVEVGD